MFLPLHDDNPIDHVSAPWMTRALIAVNVLVYVLFQQQGWVGQAVVEARIVAFGMIPAAITNAGELPPELKVIPDELTLLTYMFLHGGWLHLLVNMLFLWVFGDNVEDALGHLRFLLFYLSCGVIAGLAQTLATPASERPVIGASGAVAGCVAAYLMLHPRVKLWALVLMRIPLRLPAYWVLVAWIAVQAFSLATSTDDSTAWWNHIGGLIAGAILVIPLRRAGVPLFDRGLEPGRMSPLPPPGGSAGAAG